MKLERRAKIIELVKSGEAETQKDITDKLKHFGYEVTQATVSRDIRDLKLVKTTGEDGKQRYEFPDSTSPDRIRHARIFKDAVISVEAAQNIIVVKTLTGMAMAAAAAIDHLGLNGIVGTIAGDDTIFCVTKEIQSSVIKNMELLLSSK